MPGSRMISLGTRPDDPGHWFAKELKGPRSIVYAARPDDPIGHRRTWKRANPSLDFMPALEQRIRIEAAEAQVDPAALARFRALRLNQGVSDVIEAVLLDPGVWRDATGAADAAGAYILGFDLGQTAAMSGRGRVLAGNGPPRRARRLR